MSRTFYKEYPKGDPRAVCRSCRNHGPCGVCKSNRTWFDTKKRFAADKQLEEYENNN